MSDEQSDITTLLRNLWPTASQERCISTAEHLSPYPVEGVVAVIQAYHGTSELMPEVKIIAEVKARFPGIAQEQAARLRCEQLRSDTAARRTERQIAEMRREMRQRQPERQSIDLRIEKLTDAELVSLKSPAIDRVIQATRQAHKGLSEDRVQELRAFYGRRDPRRCSTIKSAIVELLDEGWSVAQITADSNASK
jgi:hypothetical protein